MVKYKKLGGKTKDIVEEQKLIETRSIERPKPEQGYKITKALVRDPTNPKRLVRGWKKTRVVKKNKVGGMTTAQRKLAARKAIKTKRSNPAKRRKALKKAKITRKKSKQIGLIK